MMYFFLAAVLCFISSPIVRPAEQSQVSTEFPHPQTAEEWYEWALVQVKSGDNKSASESLEKALSLKPNFREALVQLGFIHLWQGDLEASYQNFVAAETISSCNADVVIGFQEIGLKWAQVEEKQEEVVEIYTIVNQCQPNNPDTLFYLGRALGRTKHWDKAEKRLKECLQLAPQYSDAAVQLGYVYLWKGENEKAEKVFSKFPSNSDAQIGLAVATKRQGRTKEAKELLDAVIKAQPQHREAHKERARLYHDDMDYFSAETEYQWLVDDDPNESNYWSELFDIKQHTRYALFMESFYTDAKENDPSLKAPVVKDYYFLNAVHLLIPVTNRWRLDLKEIYYHQRENDIYPPIGVNYTMYSAGGRITSSYYFAKDWRWDISLRSFHAWGSQNVHYPFQSTTRVEPGTGLLYNSERQLFSVDAHTESFVIKDFAKINSKLLRTDFLTSGYVYRFDIPLKPEVEAWITHVFIRDSLKNWENTEIAVARCGVPFLTKYFTGIYRFEHGHFDQLSPNYYSFKQQLRNVIGVRMHMPITNTVSWDSYYYHRWQTTYNLFQPIGNFVFVSSKQYLAANWVSSGIVSRYKDSMRFVLEGRYFHDTLPYRDWNITGSFLWQF